MSTIYFLEKCHDVLLNLLVTEGTNRDKLKFQATKIFLLSKMEDVANLPSVNETIENIHRLITTQQNTIVEGVERTGFDLSIDALDENTVTKIIRDLFHTYVTVNTFVELKRVKNDKNLE